MGTLETIVQLLSEIFGFMFSLPTDQCSLILTFHSIVHLLFASKRGTHKLQKPLSINGGGTICSTLWLLSLPLLQRLLLFVFQIYSYVANENGFDRLLKICSNSLDLFVSWLYFWGSSLHYLNPTNLEDEFQNACQFTIDNHNNRFNMHKFLCHGPRGSQVTRN